MRVGGFEFWVFEINTGYVVEGACVMYQYNMWNPIVCVLVLCRLCVGCDQVDRELR